MGNKRTIPQGPETSKGFVPHPPACMLGFYSLLSNDLYGEVTLLGEQCKLLEETN